MGLRQWCRRVWNRIRGRSVNDEAPQNAVEEEFTVLTAEPAPEPAPDQRTSDEVIEEMAASQVEAYENCDNKEVIAEEAADEEPEKDAYE